MRSGIVSESSSAAVPPAGRLDVLVERAAVAGSALLRNTPQGGLVGAVLHGREAGSGWSVPSGDDTSVRSRLIRCRALRPSPLKKVQGDGSCTWVSYLVLMSSSSDDGMRSGIASESSSAAVPPTGRLDVVLVERAVLIVLGLIEAEEVLESMLLD